MKVSELKAALAQYPDTFLVVVDVNSEDCISDRNVLDVVEAKDTHPECATVFIQAGPMSADSSKHLEEAEATFFGE